MHSKNRSGSILSGSCTYKMTLVERSQLEIEQLLAMLRFEKRNKLADLPIDRDRSGRDDFFIFVPNNLGDLAMENSIVLQTIKERI